MKYAPFRIAARIVDLRGMTPERPLSITLDGAWRVTVYFGTFKAGIFLDGVETLAMSLLDPTGNVPAQITVLRVGGAIAGELPVLLAGQWKYGGPSADANAMFAVIETIEEP